MTLQRRPSGAPSRSCADPGLRGFAGLRDGRRMHDLMSSARYRALWPHRALSRSGAIAFANTATGSREGMPFATLTASRGDRVIIDDPRFTEMVETERERTLRIFRESVTTRLNDPALRDRGNHAAPARARRNGRDPAARPGLRSPDAANGVRAGPRLPDAELCRSAHARRRIAVPGALPAYAVAGQFEQRPAPREGGLFDRSTLCRTSETLHGPALTEIETVAGSDSTTAPPTSPDLGHGAPPRLRRRPHARAVPILPLTKVDAANQLDYDLADRRSSRSALATMEGDQPGPRHLVGLAVTKGGEGDTGASETSSAGAIRDHVAKMSPESRGFSDQGLAPDPAASRALMRSHPPSADGRPRPRVIPSC